MFKYFLWLASEKSHILQTLIGLICEISVRTYEKKTAQKWQVANENDRIKSQNSGLFERDREMWGIKTKSTKLSCVIELKGASRPTTGLAREETWVGGSRMMAVVRLVWETTDIRSASHCLREWNNTCMYQLLVYVCDVENCNIWGRIEYMNGLSLKLIELCYIW